MTKELSANAKMLLHFIKHQPFNPWIQDYSLSNACPTFATFNLVTQMATDDTETEHLGELVTICVKN